MAAGSSGTTSSASPGPDKGKAGDTDPVAKSTAAPAVTDERDGTKPAASAGPGQAPAGLPTAGVDPDSIARQAKAQMGVGTLMDDEAAHKHLDRSAKARALIAERNTAAPDRVRDIDVELRGLGFTDPLPTTAAQRGPAPADRDTRQSRQSHT